MHKLRVSWEKHFLLNELGLASAAALIFLGIMSYFGWPGIDALLDERRESLYSASASIYGALLGFSITTISIVAGIVDGERFGKIRSSTQYPVLWKTFVATIKATALALLVSIVALLADRDDAPRRLVFTAYLFAGILTTFRVTRAVWILDNVLRIQTKASPKT